MWTISLNRKRYTKSVMRWRSLNTRVTVTEVYLNAIMLQLYGSEITRDPHTFELEGATLVSIYFKSVLLDPSAICWMEKCTGIQHRK